MTLDSFPESERCVREGEAPAEPSSGQPTKDSAREGEAPAEPSSRQPTKNIVREGEAPAEPHSLLIGIPVRMIAGRLALAFLLTAFLFTACQTGRQTAAPTPLSATQRAAMQTKELRGRFDTVFSAVLSVLQDEGWQIEEVDKDSGVIQAASLKRQALIGPQDDWRPSDDPKLQAVLKDAAKARKKGEAFPEWTRWERLTVHLEPWRANTVRARIAIVKCGYVPLTVAQGRSRKGKGEPAFAASGKEQSVVLEDPAAYQQLFQQIERAVFIRRGLSGNRS